jgi:serine phosphatase RsbU (regulator of sigma subunit)
MLYLFTDGYADQFGGPKGKKFKYRQLQQLIVANAKLKMEEQKKVLENTLESWKGNLEQVDDILVIGIRI